MGWYDEKQIYGHRHRKGKEFHSDGIENIFKIILAEKELTDFSERDASPDTGKTFRTPNRQDQKRLFSCHIIIKL